MVPARKEAASFAPGSIEGRPAVVLDYFVSHGHCPSAAASKDFPPAPLLHGTMGNWLKLLMQAQAAAWLVVAFVTGVAPEWFFRQYFERSDLNLHNSNEGILLLVAMRAVALSSVAAAVLLLTVSIAASRATVSLVAIMYGLAQFCGGMAFCWFAYRPAVESLRPKDNEATKPFRYLVASFTMLLLLLLFGVQRSKRSGTVSAAGRRSGSETSRARGKPEPLRR